MNSGQTPIKGYGKVEAKELIAFELDNKNLAENIEINSDIKTEFLVLCGVPINEKITQHGSFVMNTQTEIMQALRDYQMGKMGILIEEK